MKDIQQLIKKNSQEGRYEDIFPKTFIDAVLDKESGVTLTDILAMFNMLFLSYNGSRSQTRLQVPSSLRREGLWVTYVLYDKTVVTEWYSAEAIDDTTFGDSANWRDGSNALVGDISISSDGYWVINGEVTTIKAQGETGITPILRVGSNNHLQVSYTNGSTYVDVSPNPVFTQFRVSNNKLQQSTDLGESWSNISEELAYKFRESGNKIQMSKDLGNTWEDVSDYIAAWFRFTGTTGSSQADNVGKIQISRDNGATWSDLSGEFTNSLHIKGYVATVGTLPSTAVQGDIYGVGPTYDPSDTEHTNPIYQLYVKNSTGWVNNGRFTSIAAGVVQELGNSETAVISQKAITNNFANTNSFLKNSIFITEIERTRLIIDGNSSNIELTSGYIKTDGNLGDIVNLTVNQSLNTRYAIIPCKEGDYFVISGNGGNLSRLFCFIDSSNRIILNAESRLVLSTYIKVPYNTSKLIVNFEQASDYIKKFNINNDSVRKYWVLNNSLNIYTNTFTPSPLYIQYDNNYIQSINPLDTTPITPSKNGFLVFNKKDSKYIFRLNSADIDVINDIIVFVVRNNIFYNGDSLSYCLSYHVQNLVKYKTRNTYMLYSPNNDTSYTNNSVTTLGAWYLDNGTVHHHFILENGIVTPKTFVFTINSYLVYNKANYTARIVDSYKDIGDDDVIWLYYQDGKFTDGLFYSYYMASKMNSTSIESENSVETTIKKRAYQFATIPWVALKPIASTSSSTGIEMGNHVGLPYTSCMEVDKFVGYEVSLRTFMTCANNPYSLLYTEDLSRNISGYGFTYHNTGRGTIGGYMGIVCNIFGMNAISYKIPYDAGNWKFLRKKGYFKELQYQEAKYLNIGDIIVEPGHCNVITNIEKDDSGYSKIIYWGESVMDFPKINRYSEEQANNRIAERGGIIYRRDNLYKDSYYERSPFVAVEDEILDSSYVYNDDICTFAGDYAVFRENQKIVINYNLKNTNSDWNQIELYKNDELIGTYSLVDSHNYDLSSLNLKYGNYKARLKYNSTFSDYTYFQILDTEVSYTLNDSTIKIVFNSHNGEPLFIRLCKVDGGPICIVELTEDDKRKGFIEFDYNYYGNGQGYSIVNGGTYLKVYFESEYGRVTNEPILTTI